MLNSKRFWIWFTFIFVNLIVILAAAWYLPPKFYPVWTMKHSPFQQQKLLVIAYHDWTKASDEILVQKCLFDLRTPNHDTEKLIIGELEESVLNNYRNRLYESLPTLSGYNLYRALCYLAMDSDWEFQSESKLQEVHASAMVRLAESYPQLALNLYIEIGNYGYNVGPLFEIQFLLEQSQIGIAANKRLATVAQIHPYFMLDYFKSQQQEDGSWNQEGKLTALILLNYLASGYDHKTPGRYKDEIAQGLDYLKSVSPLELSEEARNWRAMTLGEAYAMTMDLRLKDPCSQEAKRIASNMKHFDGFSEQHIPEVMAFKALKAAGTMAVSGNYMTIKNPDFLQVDQGNTLEFAAYVLAETFSGSTSSHVATLTTRFTQNELDFTKPLSTEDLKTCYILYLSSFLNGGTQFKEFRQVLLNNFTKLEHFEFDEDGHFQGLFKASFIDRSKLLESMAYTNLMLCIEARFQRVQSRMPNSSSVTP